MFVLARVMPQRTMSGAMVYAWLAAYRRTLERTLAGARSMDDVVASHALPWVETPDQAVVWGYALGLHHEVEDVLERSIETGREAAASGLRPPYLPAWYVIGLAAGSSGGASGLFSSSAIPDFGGMTAALSTIGASPSSSSGGSSGGLGAALAAVAPVVAVVAPAAASEPDQPVVPPQRSCWTESWVAPSEPDDARATTDPGQTGASRDVAWGDGRGSSRPTAALSRR